MHVILFQAYTIFHDRVVTLCTVQSTLLWYCLDIRGLHVDAIEHLLRLKHILTWGMVLQVGLRALISLYGLDVCKC